MKHDYGLLRVTGQAVHTHQRYLSVSAIEGAVRGQINKRREAFRTCFPPFLCVKSTVFNKFAVIQPHDPRRRARILKFSQILPAFCKKQSYLTALPLSE